MFHCSFTGARLWKRSTFLLGLGKAISESPFGALAVFYGFCVNFSACARADMETERIRCRPVHESWIKTYYSPEH